MRLSLRSGAPDGRKIPLTWIPSSFSPPVPWHRTSSACCTVDVPFRLLQLDGIVRNVARGNRGERREQLAAVGDRRVEGGAGERHDGERGVVMDGAVRRFEDRRAGPRARPFHPAGQRARRNQPVVADRECAAVELDLDAILELHRRVGRRHRQRRPSAAASGWCRAQGWHWSGSSRGSTCPRRPRLRAAGPPVRSTSATRRSARRTSRRRTR